MTPADFRRIALSLQGVEEYSHAVTVESGWLADGKVQSDLRMLAALNGERSAK